MTRKIFWDDPYAVRNATTVADVVASWVRVAETVSSLSPGGQERDHGTIGGYEVLDAQWEGLDLIYELADGHDLRVGDEVEVVIDAERRDRLRRLHMATEVVLELLTQDDPSLIKVGAHIGAQRARIDFATEAALRDRLPRIKTAANTMVADDLAIVSEFSDAAAQRRYWEIDGFARVPCSGTHPERTGEIGPIELRRSNPGRGRERVEITLVRP